MSREALIEDLRRKAAEDAEAIWRNARAEAENWRLDAAREIEALRIAKTHDAAEAAERQEAVALAEAGRRSREVRAATVTALAERLRRIAEAGLRQLRLEGAGRLFAALADELPTRDWQRVRVNPLDAELARDRFRQAEIVCDDAICGGMDVEAEDGRIRVCNTLEARLEAAWPDILPGLVAEVLRDSDGHGTAA